MGFEVSVRHCCPPDTKYLMTAPISSSQTLCSSCEPPERGSLRDSAVHTYRSGFVYRATVRTSQQLDIVVNRPSDLRIQVRQVRRQFGIKSGAVDSAGPIDARICHHRRLRVTGLITRIPGKNRYRLTGDGLRFAIFYTKLHDRLLRPLLATGQPPAPPPFRKALHTIDIHITESIDRARLLPNAA